MPGGHLLRAVRPIVATALALALWPLIADAVLVAPHALFLSDRSRTGEVFLINQSAEPEDVHVALQFGFPATDSAGNIGMRLFEEPGPEYPSAAAWLRAFPQRVRVEPGRRQALRLQAMPPRDLPDGEYWSRLVVTSRPAPPPITSAGDSAVRAGIALELRTITSVTYRKGAVRTGIRLDSLAVRARSDTVEVWIGLAREGNAAFLGTVRFELRAIERDGVLRDWLIPLGVYYRQDRRFALPVDGIAAGRYRLRVFVSTDREDIPARDVLPASPIERVVEIALP